MLPPPYTGVWSQFDVHTAQDGRKAYYISGAGVGIQIPKGCIEKVAMRLRYSISKGSAGKGLDNGLVPKWWLRQLIRSCTPLDAEELTTFIFPCKPDFNLPMTNSMIILFPTPSLSPPTPVELCHQCAGENHVHSSLHYVFWGNAAQA